MKSIHFYYLILFAYLSLWTCQMIASHMTHTLIILAESYINIYRILDVIIAIMSWGTQQTGKTASNRSHEEGRHHKDSSSCIKLMGRYCTYQFKRLPLLGSFVNELFLAALLISAAIEGIQTCLHVSHLESDGKASILLANPITYPSLLLGFALVAVFLQWSLSKTHELRDEEFHRISVSESITARSALGLSQLNAGDLCLQPIGKTTKSRMVRRDNQFDEKTDRTISKLFRFWTSPVALATCAAIVFFSGNELFKEVADAALVILLVISLFAASYPSIKSSGKVLLQSAPNDLEVDFIKEQIKSISSSIINIEKLEIWSLAESTGRVITCHVSIDKATVNSSSKVSEVISKLQAKFQELQVDYSTIQPILIDNSPIQVETESETETERV